MTKRNINESGFAHLQLLVVALVLVAAVGGAGWYVVSKNSDHKTSLSESSNEAENKVEQELLPADFVPQITLDTARATAESQSAGKTVESVELEKEHGSVVYKVKFISLQALYSFIFFVGNIIIKIAK